MHVDARGPNGQRALAELRDDGSIYAAGQLVGRIRGTQLLDPAGNALLDVAPDGTLRHGEREIPMQLSSDGDLVTERGRLTIGADLAVTAIDPSGTTHPLGFQFDRVPPEARRTAALLLFVVLSHLEEHDEAVLPRLAIPSRSNGRLEASDHLLSDGSVVDRYALTLHAGQPVTIVVRGGDSTSTPGQHLDVYTLLMRGGNEVTHDDDSAGNFNSRIIYTPTVDGEYALWVTTYGAGLKTGPYEVEIWNGARANAQ